MKIQLCTGALILLASCQSGKNEKVPVVRNDSTTVANTHTMKFNSGSSELKAGVPLSWELVPTITDSSKPVPLEVLHEKKIHLILVSSDLSYFRHLHPTENTDGSFLLTHQFENGGDYIAFADFKPRDAEAIVSKQHLRIGGPSASQVEFDKESLVDRIDEYEVKLKQEPKELVTGAEMMLTADISRNGIKVPPVELENYLGEKGHMVLISVAGKEFLHVHPMVMNGELMFHARFPKEGLYRAWVEFQQGGVVKTADFTLKVAKGDDKDAGHGHH